MSLPIIQSASDLTGNEGKPVKICGDYGIQDLGGYAVKVKAANGSWKRVRKIAFVKLEDGIFIELENRPDDEMKMLNGRRVMATGKLIMAADPPPKPVMARPGPVPTLVEIDSIQPLHDKRRRPSDR